jgi:hypothetical protein
MPALPSATRRSRRALAVPALAFGAAFLAACATPERETPAADTPQPAAATATNATDAAATTGSAAPAAAYHGHGTTASDTSTLVVYKSPSCGCCAKWVDHMREHGFKVAVHDMEDVSPIKAKHGVTDQLSSCHTATIGGYVVEGHVPAADVQRLLRERPSIAGIATPGMPMGSPGMEGGRVDRYDVMAFDRSGGTRVFASH